MRPTVFRTTELNYGSLPLLGEPGFGPAAGAGSGPLVYPRVRKVALEVSGSGSG